MIVCKLKDGKFYDKKAIDDWLMRSNAVIDFEEIEVDTGNVTDAQFSDLVNGVFSLSLYEKRKQRQYENRVEELIRERYTISQEFAILRQRDSKPEEFDVYNTFAENCKSIAKQERTLGLI